MIVTRNRCSPQIQNEYLVTIPENKAVNSQVIKVQATDCDTQFNFGNLTYQVIGDDNAPVSSALYH